MQEVVRSSKHLETHFETDSTHGIMASSFSVFFMPDILSMDVDGRYLLMEDVLNKSATESRWDVHSISAEFLRVLTEVVKMKAGAEVSLAVSKPCLKPWPCRGVLCNEAALPSKGFGDGSAHNEEAQLYSPQPTHDDWLCRYMSEHLEVKVVR